jgi:subtilisin family serine protease
MNKLLLSLTGLAVGSVMSTQLSASELARHVPGEIIVKFKPGINASNFFKNISPTFSDLSLKREIHLSYQKLNVLTVTDEKILDTTLQLLKNNPDVIYAEPNFIYEIAVMPKEVLTAKAPKKLEASPFAFDSQSVTDDALFGQLWGLKNTGSNEPQGKAGVEGADVNALKAWDLTTGSRAVKIAVIDTGVDYNHPDLAGNVWVNQAELKGKSGVDDDGNGYIDDIHGYDFANTDSDPMDGHGHGTHCSGTIGAIHNNKIGVAGVMGEVTIVPVKFLDDSGSGTLEAAVLAIDYATKLNVDLMSNSWGGGGRSEALYEAIKRASDKGIIFTAAAGNSSSNNDSSPSYPASYESPNVVSVAALTAQNDLASFSSYGRNSVHIAAPGRNILSTVKGGKYEVMSGTSMATPHVSGVLGLLLAKEGRLNHEVLRERLISTGAFVSALRGKTQSASRIDAYNLLTDNRPERSGPVPSAWRTVKLEEIFESAHPYKENMNVSRTLFFPGAKYIRVKVAKYDLETGYDYVRLADKSHVTVEKITGVGENFLTDYVEGDTVELNFVTDRSFNKWGFKIEEVQIQ